MEEVLESKRALKDTQTSYQLTPQCQVFLPPAAETRQLSSGAGLGQGVSQSQRPQYQALLPLLAELQLAQPGQARLQALLGPTALHSHRERERTMHAPPSCKGSQAFWLNKRNYFPSFISTFPRFTRALAGYKGPCCIPLLMIVRLPWSSMVSQTI